MNIFFGELNYQTVTQLKAYSFGSLLGDIGGQMGLFIGASILTLLEFGEYFSILISTKVTQAFQSNRKRTRSQSFEYENKKVLELDQRLTTMTDIDDDVDDCNSYNDALHSFVDHIRG